MESDACRENRQMPGLEAPDGRRPNRTIEGGQRSPTMYDEREEVGVGDLSVPGKMRCLQNLLLEDRDVVGPVAVVPAGRELSKASHRIGDGSPSSRIGRVRYHSHEAVLRHG